MLITLSVPAPAQAARDDAGIIADGQYFTVKAFSGIDVATLLKKLNYDHFLQVDTFLLNHQTSSAPQDLLAKNVDALYREVQEILGLQVSAFRATIYICPDDRGVQNQFKKIYGMDFHERSFFVFDTNTIFISFQDLTLGMLGHEMAHAIISAYFVVPPPTKVQEVLAGYVEFNLRKIVSH